MNLATYVARFSDFWPSPIKSAAFVQRQEIVRPDAVGISLQELVTRSASVHSDPRFDTPLIGVKAMGLLFDKAHDIRHRVLPAPETIRLRSAHMRNVLMRAVTVKFINAINPVVRHAATFLEKMTRPKRRVIDLLGRAG